jgi:ENTH domain
MVEEATSGSSWSPDAKTMGFISRSAFDSDSYYRIIDILHKRLISYDLIINRINCSSAQSVNGTKYINVTFFIFLQSSSLFFFFFFLNEPVNLQISVVLCDTTTRFHANFISFKITKIRLSKFERKHWREAYNSLVVLEHLLTHGPKSIAVEFQGESGIIQEMLTLQYIDEKG